VVLCAEPGGTPFQFAGPTFVVVVIVIVVVPEFRDRDEDRGD
jgi:hypothetical protein